MGISLAAHSDPFRFKSLRSITTADDAASTFSSVEKKKDPVTVTVTSPVDVESEAERIMKRIDGAVLVQFYSIRSPICFSITGYKNLGASKVKEMDVGVQFLPDHLRNKNEAKTAIINQCQRSTDDYRIVDSFDLTKVPREGFPFVKLVYPCTHCNLEETYGGHDGAVQVNVKTVYNGLVDKQKYIEYQLNCESTSLPIGSVIFFKLKKPQTGLRQKLSSVSRKCKESIPYVSPVLSAIGGVVGWLVKN